MFYPLGTLYTWDVTCELFEYSNERISTGIPEIDSFETLKKQLKIMCGISLNTLFFSLLQCYMFVLQNVLNILKNIRSKHISDVAYQRMVVCFVTKDIPNGH